MSELTHNITFLTGEKRVVFEELVRIIMPRPKWWEWRYRRDRAEIKALAATYGMKVYES